MRQMRGQNFMDIDEVRGYRQKLLMANLFCDFERWLLGAGERKQQRTEVALKSRDKVAT
jgi:hypothetical protein